MSFSNSGPGTVGNHAASAWAQGEGLTTGMGAWFARFVWFAGALVAIQVVVYTPMLSWRLFSGRSGYAEWIIGLAALVVVGATLSVFWCQLLPAMERLGTIASRVPLRGWLLWVIAIGTLLRLAWVWVLPAQPSSDGATYVGLALRLAHGEPYQAAGRLAFWPPGYPLLLSLLLPLGGPFRTVLLGLNVILFVAVTLVTAMLGRRLAGDTAAPRISTLLLAIWPGYVAAAGLPEKELVLITLLPAVVLLHLRAAPDKLGAGSALLAGLLLGFGSLVQPSLMLFPCALLAIDIIVCRAPARWLSRAFIVTMGMVVVIAPWSIRNYLVFGEFVPISTNGGDTFYRANNPIATGGYTKRGEVDLSGLPELEANRRGFELGRSWIAEHPGAFLRLAAGRHILFLGDDAQGIYSTMQRGGLDVSLWVYATAKSMANGLWMIIWVFVGIVALQRLRGQPQIDSTAVLLLPFIYLYLLHSVFESGAKYHFPALAFVMLAAGLAFNPRRHA